MKRLIAVARPDTGLYALALVAAPLTALAGVWQPTFLREAVDRGVLTGDAEVVARAALGWLALALVAFATEGLYTVALALAATRTITRLREAVFAHALSLGQSFHDTEPTGRLLSRLTSDVEALGETLSTGALTIVVDVLVIVGVVSAMAWLDPTLTAVLLLVAPPLGLAVEAIRRRMRALFASVRTHLAEMVAFAAERITGIEVVQLHRDEARAQAEFQARLGRYIDATVALNVWDAVLFALVDGVTSITMALMLWYAASPWFGDAVTAGLLAAFVDYVGRLFMPLRELSGKVSSLQRAGAALEKLGALLATEVRVRPGHRDLPEEPGPVEVRDLAFAYGDGPDALRGVSLDVRPGEVVALVGRTGSGKTTIGKLLARAYDGWRGRITIDGVDHAEVRLDALGRRIGMVHQDVVLFPGTVRSNLALGKDIPDARLREALALAEATAVVERLGGLDGRIEAHGRNLSVGEGQLLAFARVLARDTPLVILDEATASVDSLTEARIRAATRNLLATRTVLVVAHRLSTVMDADRIVVLDAGRVVEAGTHEALLASAGAYARLFESQIAQS